MPIPKPDANEDKQKFISRCMGDDVMNRDYPKQEVRAGVCYSQWRESRKDLSPVEDGLIQSMAEEIGAAAVYETRMKEVGDPAIAAVYQHIISEEYEHFNEFHECLEGKAPAPVPGAELEVHFAGTDILADYKGMNPAFARVIGFPIKDNELLILQGLSDADTAETIQHERDENDMINAGMKYWPAHYSLQKREEAMSNKSVIKPRAVKFVDEDQGIIEGMAAPFGGPLGGKDLQGEYFSKKTDFCEGWFASRPILYHHGMDENIKAVVIGHDTATKMTDNGRWLQAQLDKSAAYWKELKTLINQGKVFFSTGAVPHLVEKAVDGELLRWPWVETSLTVSPAHPGATVDSFKAVDFLKAVGATDEQVAVIRPRIAVVASDSVIPGAVKDANGKGGPVVAAKDAVKGVPGSELLKTLGDKPVTSQDIKDARVYDVTGDPNIKITGKEANVAKKAMAKCPKCGEEFEVPAAEAPEEEAEEETEGGKTAAPEAAGTPPADPKVTGSEHAPAGDKEPPATNPGVGQGMGAETHVGTERTIGSPEQSGQHEGATAAPAKPEGDKTPGAGKGETPKPSAMVPAKEPDPPPSASQAQDNTHPGGGKSVETKGEEAAKAVSDASKAAQEGLKALFADHLKAVEVSVKEAFKPLEERIKSLEAAPAEKGPIRRVPNPANPLKEESPSELKAMFDDPKTPPSVKAYIGQQLAADEVSQMLREGPQRLGRRPAEQ